VSTKSETLQKGDWIVHLYYGIGQIVGTETKKIGGEKVQYYKVRTKNSTYFVPVTNAINDRIRPLSSEYKLRKAKQILREEPQEFPDNHNERRKYLNETTSDRSIYNSAQLIRDLAYRKHHHGLNDFEKRALENTEQLFVLEWSIIQEISEEEAHEKLEKIIEETNE
jgi:RNA polymerase-interacting CarD/CdnL/TRCF family regulator